MTGPPSTSRLTQDDLQAIIDLVVAYTGREPDRTLVETWAAQAAIGRWTYPHAACAIHLWASNREPRDFLDPADVTRAIRAVRRKAAATFELPRIPEGLPNADYPAWLRARRDEHVSALVDAWAATGEEPPVQIPAGPPPNQIGQRRLAELTAGAFHDVPSAADPAGNPPTPEGVQVRRTALATHCPYCSARPGEQCTRPGVGGRVPITHPHPARTGHSSAAEEAS
jgi:hypothetical protein